MIRTVQIENIIIIGIGGIMIESHIIPVTRFGLQDQRFIHGRSGNGIQPLLQIIVTIAQIQKNRVRNTFDQQISHGIG